MGQRERSMGPNGCNDGHGLGDGPGMKGESSMAKRRYMVRGLGAVGLAVALAGCVTTQTPQTGQPEPVAAGPAETAAPPSAAAPSAETPVAAAPVAAPVVKAPVPAAQPSSAAVAAPAPAGARAGQVELTLVQFLQQVKENNDRIENQNLDRQIAEQTVTNAAAIYEPVLTASAGRKSIRQLNTAEESLSRSGLALYDHSSWQYQTGVSVLAPTGAIAKAEVGLEKIDSNLQNSSIRGRENTAFYNLSVTQPLARDAGRSVTEANINIAKVNSAIAVHAGEETTMTVMSQATSAYLDLRLAQERQRIWAEGVQVAERLAAEVRLMQRQGQLDRAAGLEAENGIARARIQETAARQRLVEVMNACRSLLVSSANRDPGPLVARDPLPTVALPRTDFEESMARAITRRPDFLARKQVVEREGIRIAYAENQVLPRIDLVSSFGLNGLALSSREALFDLERNRQYPTWSAGLQVSFPLNGNERSTSELSMAKLRQHQALVDLKAIEMGVANDIETSMSAIRSAYNQWMLYKSALDVQRELVVSERQLLNAGRSDVRTVLAREDAVIFARLALAEQAVAFEKARVSLKLAEGTLLD